MKITKIISSEFTYMNDLQIQIEELESEGYEVVQTLTSSAMNDSKYLRTNITVVMQINN